MGVNVYLEDFHLKPTVRCGAIWYLEGLNKGLCELLHHRKDQNFGCTLVTETKANIGHTANQWLQYIHIKHRNTDQKSAAIKSLEVSPKISGFLL